MIQKLARILTIGTVMAVAAMAGGGDGDWDDYHHHHKHKVPEINPASGTSSLLLMAGAIVLLRGRRKTRPEAG